VTISYLDALAGDDFEYEYEDEVSYLDLLSDGMDKDADFIVGPGGETTFRGLPAVISRGRSSEMTKFKQGGGALARSSGQLLHGSQRSNKALLGAAQERLLLADSGMYKKKQNPRARMDSGTRLSSRSTARPPKRVEPTIEVAKSKGGAGLGLGALGALGLAGAGAKGLQMRRAAQARSLRNKKIAIGAGAGAAGLAGLAALASRRRGKRDDDEGQSKTASYLDVLSDGMDKYAKVDRLQRSMDLDFIKDLRASGPSTPHRKKNYTGLGLGALGALGAAGAGAKGVQMRRAAQARSLRNKKIAIGAGAGAAGLAGLAALASSRRSKSDNDEG